MAFLQNEFSYDASDVELEKWTLNDSSYDSSDVQLQKTTLNIPYKQIAFLNNESSYDFSGVQIQPVLWTICCHKLKVVPKIALIWFLRCPDTENDIPYKQIAFLHNESSYDSSGVQLQKITMNIP